uniref:Medium-chain acyl-[acyl-carrier-protein] hydrolase n=1 Tax=Candidatus Kentrum sp. DK TaxID=2126562 RepID=A0A450S4S8_9GAMM|nr:MAG: medium-chain acyl-[acyl-carrier-protein] hydrolase [Candidatus Kentron sp. DK]
MKNDWIAGVENPRAKLRLFCFPFAGGGALAYRTWPEQLPPEVEVCSLRLPGREGRLREAPYREAAPLAAAIASGIAEQYLDLPFVFYGHSMGAVVAFELARTLRRRATPEPLCLLVSGRRAPQVPFGQKLRSNLPKPEFIEVLRHYGGTPEILFQEDELMDLFLPTMRADFALTDEYVYAPEAPLDYPIHAFHSEEDPAATRDEAEPWREQTSGDFTLRMFPGGHFFFNDAATKPIFLGEMAGKLETFL